MQLSHVLNQFSMLHYLNFPGFDLNSTMNWLAMIIASILIKSYNYKTDFIYLAENIISKQAWRHLSKTTAHYHQNRKQ